MSTNPLSRTEQIDESLMQRVWAIDLARIKEKLQHPEEGKGWSTEECGRVEILYRRFLYLCATERDFPIVPTREIDDMWHQHILDTRAYGRDCQAALGRFLHHNPYFGMNGMEDRQALETAFAKTAELYGRTFGEPYTEMDRVGAANNPPPPPLQDVTSSGSCTSCSSCSEGGG